jgi:hypothetical protein
MAAFIPYQMHSMRSHIREEGSGGTIGSLGGKIGYILLQKNNYLCYAPNKKENLRTTK